MPAARGIHLKIAFVKPSNELSPHGTTPGELTSNH